MREAAFVKQNKDKWLKFESLLQNKKTISPEVLSALYLEVSDHLSYAQTFYPNSNTTTYLNEIASSAHQRIYSNKKESRNRFLSFYLREFPYQFYAFQKQLLLSFLIFLLFAAIGAFSAAHDASFVRSILGDAYVNMTLENIANNDPMAVYKEASSSNMFLGITLNNIKVGLMAFSLGILGGLGTIFILMQNALMLGSFQYFFFDKGVFWESVKTVWIHGTIEISVIIVAGCAGLVIGKSILFPNTYSRLRSFTMGVKNGLKIIMSTLPFFVVAGFLEGFVTRLTEMPVWLSIFIITASLCLILFYYVYYPIYLHKNQLKSKNDPGFHSV